MTARRHIVRFTLAGDNRTHKAGEFASQDEARRMMDQILKRYAGRAPGLGITEAWIDIAKPSRRQIAFSRRVGEPL